MTQEPNYCWSPQDNTNGPCPYCGHSKWQNSWNKGNSRCLKCNNEFNISFVDSDLKGFKIASNITQEDNNVS